MRGAFIVAVGAVFACVPLGENAARIRGEIVTSEGSRPPRCTLSIHRAKDGEVVHEAPIGNPFEVSVLVAPREAPYYATVQCRGFSGRFVSEQFVLGSPATFIDEIDLGQIDLSRDAAEQFSD
jgi:hypothetical protein